MRYRRLTTDGDAALELPQAPMVVTFVEPDTSRPKRKTKPKKPAVKPPAAPMTAPNHKPTGQEYRALILKALAGGPLSSGALAEKCAGATVQTRSWARQRRALVDEGMVVAAPGGRSRLYSLPAASA